MRFCRFHTALSGLYALAWSGLVAGAEPLALVPIASSAHVQVLDLRDGSSVGLIPVASGPIGIAINRVQRRAYVAHQGGNRVTVIDTAHLTVIQSLDLPTDAWGIALSPDGSRAYVALSGQSALGVINTATMSLIDTVATGDTPRSVVLSPDGSRAYTANQNDGSISVIDTSDNSLVGDYPLCSAPLGLVMRPGGAIVYAVCGFEAALVRFDTSSHSVVGSTALPSGASAVAISNDATRIYVSRTSGDSVSVIDGASHAVLTEIPVGDGPYGISVSDDGSRIHVVNVHSASLSVIASPENIVIASHPLLGGAFAVGSVLAPSSVPAAPLIGAATATDGAAHISFSAPVFDGGTPILDYAASCGAVTVTGVPPSILVSGLSNGVSYACSVRARNEVGSSAASASVQVTPATYASAPEIVQITPGNEQATIQFNPSADNGGSAITHYSAVCNPGAIADQHEISPIVVGGLSNGVVYRCALRAHNGVGASALSNELSVIPGDNGSSANLAISKSNGSDFVGAGNRVGYLIAVSNPGPAAVAGARVSDVMESYFSAPEWSCVGNGGAQCAAASGQGDLDLLVDLPIGSSADIVITALLAPLPEDPVSNVAAVSLPATMSDPDTSNNIASDGPDIRGIFRDEFE